MIMVMIAKEELLKIKQNDVSSWAIVMVMIVTKQSSGFASLWKNKRPTVE